VRKPSAWNQSSFRMAFFAAALWVLATPSFANEAAHERVIHLKGTTNTRDIGGYLTGDMSQLRWGEIFRSDELSRLTASDFQKLEAMGLKTVIDLRTTKEHDESPTRWQGDHPPRFYNFPVGDSNDEWFSAQRSMMKKNRFTQEQALVHMVAGYRLFADEGTASFRKMMEVVLDESNWPLLIHCSAGKDRSGIAVALIMEALGVDHETIMEEYLLTNKVSRIGEKAEMLSKESRNASRGNRFSKGTPPSAWLPIVGVDAGMLEAFYAEVDDRYGSMDAYLVELGVDRDARHTLAATLTTAQPQLAQGE